MVSIMSINAIIRSVLGAAGIVVVPAVAFDRTGIGATLGQMHDLCIHSPESLSFCKSPMRQEQYLFPRLALCVAA